MADDREKTADPDEVLSRTKSATRKRVVEEQSWEVIMEPTMTTEDRFTELKDSGSKKSSSMPLLENVAAHQGEVPRDDHHAPGGRNLLCYDCPLAVWGSRCRQGAARS
jgi:hypothetical protein